MWKTCNETSTEIYCLPEAGDIVTLPMKSVSLVVAYSSKLFRKMFHAPALPRCFRKTGTARSDVFITEIYCRLLHTDERTFICTDITCSISSFCRPSFFGWQGDVEMTLVNFCRNYDNHAWKIPAAVIDITAQTLIQYARFPWLPRLQYHQHYFKLVNPIVFSIWIGVISCPVHHFLKSV